MREAISTMGLGLKKSLPYISVLTLAYLVGNYVPYGDLLILTTIGIVTILGLLYFIGFMYKNK